MEQDTYGWPPSGVDSCGSTSNLGYEGFISARIPDEVEAELEAVAELLDDDGSTVIRKALSEGLGDLRVRVAVERHQTGEISTNQAARVAGVSVAEWLETARERNLTTQLTPTDLDDDVAAGDL